MSRRPQSRVDWWAASAAFTRHFLAGCANRSISAPRAIRRRRPERSPTFVRPTTRDANRMTVTTLKRAGVPAPDSIHGAHSRRPRPSWPVRTRCRPRGDDRLPALPVRCRRLPVQGRDRDSGQSTFRSRGSPCPAWSGSEPLEVILRRSDPTFEAIMSRTDKLPRKFRSAKTKFEVDVVTTPDAAPSQCFCPRWAAAPNRWRSWTT